MTFYFCTRFTSNLFHGQLLLCALIELIRQSLALSEKKGSAALQKTTPTGACVSRSQTHIVRTDAVKGEAAPPQACFHLHPFFPPRMQEPTESSLPDWVHAVAFWAACIAAGFANIFFFQHFGCSSPQKAALNVICQDSNMLSVVLFGSSLKDGYFPPPTVATHLVRKLLSWSDADKQCSLSVWN